MDGLDVVAVFLYFIGSTSSSQVLSTMEQRQKVYDQVHKTRTAGLLYQG